MIIINDFLLNRISEKASQSERLRKNYNFHHYDADPMQRMLNAMEPGTYIRPHKHEKPDKREIFIILKGSVAFVIFNNTGDVTDIVILDSTKGVFGIEIPPATWHTLVALKKKSVLYEIKDGPYDAAHDKMFADWAPPENATDAEAYLFQLKRTISNYP